MDKKIVKKIDKYINDELPNPNPAFRMCVYAPSYSGKSYFINKLLTDKKYGYYKIFKPNNIYVFSPTFKSDSSYDELKDKMKKADYDNAMNYLDYDKIEEIIKEQKDMKRRKQAEPVLFLIDDLITQIPSRGFSKITDLFFSGRHAFISIILTSQTFKSVPKAIRLNADSNIYFYNNMNKKEIKEICEEAPDDDIEHILERLKNNRDENRRYDFLYMNMKKSIKNRYYLNMTDKITTIE